MQRPSSDASKPEQRIYANVSDSLGGKSMNRPCDAGSNGKRLLSAVEELVDLGTTCAPEAEGDVRRGGRTSRAVGDTLDVDLGEEAVVE